MPRIRASRPHMPGYGISADEAGLLPWSWAAERLAACRNYWVATLHPAGRPHVMPVWGVWIEDAFMFSCGLESRRARNLERNPACTIAVEAADEAVVVEGMAERGLAAALLPGFLAAYKAKYDFELDESQIEGTFVVRPRVVFAFIEAEAQFATTATRWTFDG